MANSAQCWWTRTMEVVVVVDTVGVIAVMVLRQGKSKASLLVAD